MKTRIRILVDNNVKPHLGLMPEHGFSALVERDGGIILFDTGKGDALPHNAEILGVDLRRVDCVILSHGHYDHTGGLPHVVRYNPHVEVVAHPRALSSHLVVRPEESGPKEIGIPFRPDDLLSQGVRFSTEREFRQVLPGVWFTGEVPRKLGAGTDDRLCIRNERGFVADPLEDDASVVLESESGPILLLGCGHAGVRNILDHVRRKLSLSRIHALIGGTHLGFSESAEIPKFIDAVEQWRVQCVAPGHCTGLGPRAVLRDRLSHRFREAFAGTVFEF